MVKLVRASAVNLGVSIGETVIGALATLYFARLLGAGPMGSYFLAMGLVNWVLIPSGGISSAVLKRISEGTKQDQFFTAGLLLQLGYLGAIAACVFLLGGPINDYLEFEGTALVAAVLLTLGLARFANAVIRAENRVEIASLLEGGRNIARAVLQLGFVFVSGAGLIGLFAGEVVAAALISVVTLGLIRPKLVLPRRKQFADLYEYGKYSWLGNLKVNAYSWTDTLVLGLFVSTTVVGTYEIAWRVSALFILLPAAMGSTVFPSISGYAKRGETEPIRRIIERMVPFAPALAIPGAVGALVIGPHVLGLYGSEFAAGVIYLLVLSFARIVESVERLLEQVLNALDYPERTFRIAVIFICLNTSLNFGLVLLVGAPGAAAATLLSMIVSGVVAWHSLPAEVTPAFPVRTIGVQLCSAAVMGVVVSTVIAVRPPKSDWDVVAYVLVGAIIYGAGLLFSSETREVFRQFVREVSA